MNLINPVNFCWFDDHPLSADLTANDLHKLAQKIRQAHKQPSAVLAFKAFAALANRVEKAMLRGQHSPCRQGCSICCHRLPLLYRVEMIALAREIKNSSQVVKDLVLSRAMTARARLKDLEVTYYGYVERPGTDHLDAFGPLGGVCPLLSSDGSCMFYAHRPLACRLWYVIGECPCVCGEHRSRVIALPAKTKLCDVLKLSGTALYTPIDAIIRGCSSDK